MDQMSLRIFIEAADLGSLSKVALAHDTSQPQISRRISDLEQVCGGRLLHRNGRGVALTEFGQRIAPKVRSWLNSTEQLQNEILEVAGKPMGRVRMGVMPSAAHPLVTRLYDKMRQAYPLVQLSVREGQGAQLETWLEDGSLDFAVLYRHQSSPKNGDIYLNQTTTYVVGAKDDAFIKRDSVGFSELDGKPLVLFCRPSSWRDRLDQISADCGITLNVVLEADSLALQTRIVATGGVYALLGPYAIDAALKSDAIQAVPLVDPSIIRHVALSLSRHGELTLACRTVMRELQSIAKNLPLTT
ncbi:MAG TPA: LysR family transcriptional regulator [Burkholderiaceae bacterium]|nr:LysR family transcriptional regulator [Burkholderiaceae bacterium]